MITRTHAVATLLSADLVTGAASLVVAQDASQPSPVELYKKGIEQLQAGSLQDAKATLQRVDPLQLPESDRPAYMAALRRVDEAAAPAALPEVAPEAKAPAAVKPAAPAPAKETEKPAAKAAPKPVPASTGKDPFVQARGKEAAALVAAGDDAMAKQAYAQAVGHYGKAVQMDPENAMLRSKLAAATSAQSKNAPDALKGDLMRYEIEHKRVRAEFGTDIEDAKAKLAARDYAGAGYMVSSARARVNQGREWLEVSEFEGLQRQANSVTDAIDAQQQQEKLIQLKAASKAPAADAIAVNERQNRVDNLIRAARALQRNGQNAQALAAAEQAVSSDPSNMAAQMLVEVLRDEYCLRESDRLLKTSANKHADLALENREAVIPYTDLITYPTDWPQMSNRRINAVTGASIESDLDRSTRHLLDEKYIETVDFNNDELQTTLNFVRDSTGVNMVILWGAIEQAGVKRDRAVTQKLKHVTAAQLLKSILDSVSTELDPENRLAYAVQNGIVTIGTRRELKQVTVESNYDVRDLLVNIENFKDAPSFSLTSALTNTTAGNGSSTSGDIFQNTSTPEAGGDESKLVDELITRIKEHVGTKVEWDENLSVISAYHSQLLVKTTPENHRSLAKLLESFRQNRSVQISVESRFLFVDNNFLEEFGVDLDMTFAGNNGLSPITVNQGHAPTQSNGSPGMAGRPSNSLTPSAWKNSTSSGAQPQAMTLGASYLSDLQVDLLVSATQARRTGATLTAPRITFFNGQRAYVLVGRQVAFVSNLEPIQQTTAAKATVSTVQSGVVLDVEGTASADRRYVTLTLRPSLATLKEPMRQIEVRAASQINVNNGGTGVGNLNPFSGGAANSQGTVLGFIEAPELELTQIRTTVSIPDRGTLMTGGQRLVSETQIEAGVPVLSKIPIIDRLFSNTTQVRDERTLLVLIKPTIVLQNEEEERRWPGGQADWGSYNMVSEPSSVR